MTERANLTANQLFLMSAFWFSTSFHWMAILVILLPVQVLQMVGEVNKGKGMAGVVALGAIISLALPPVAGAWSDRTRTPIGRRKPYMLAGILINLAGLLGLALSHSYVGCILFFLVVTLGNNLATAPYSALIPDLVGERQRGSASGWMGLMSMLGNLLGAFTGFAPQRLGVPVEAIYGIIAPVLIFGFLLTFFGIQEPSIPPTAPFHWREFFHSLWIDPKKYPDFSWVFLTRLFVMFGFYTVEVFIQYYFKDVITSPYVFFRWSLGDDPKAAVAFFSLPLLLGATLSTLQAGAMSDRFGRKVMVYLAGGLMAFTGFIFLTTHSYRTAIFIGLVFGLGYGMYVSVDWALATDTLPSTRDYAKDMGIWHIATVFPQVLTVIGGALLDYFQSIGSRTGIPTLGYTTVFLLAIICFVSGTVLVSRIRGVR